MSDSITQADNETGSGMRAARVRRSDRARGAAGKPVATPAHSKADAPHGEQPATPVTKKGQRYVPPAGRHSQQSHKRAEERGALLGNATEREQHAHDRTVAVIALNHRAEQKAIQDQRTQAARNPSQKASAKPEEKEAAPKARKKESPAAP